jgi:miniconductance mechanosensitive channel
METLPALPSAFTLDDVALLLGLAFAAGVAYLIIRRLLMGFGARLIGRMNQELAKALERHRVLPAAALLTPVLVIAFARPLLQQRMGWALPWINQLLEFSVIVVIALALHRLLNALEELFTRARQAEEDKWIHGLFKWLRVAEVATAVVLALGAFANVQVTWVLAALGVIVATGSIVFSDMIYNAVSHMILKGNKLVAVGDWLEVPALQIDGEVKAIRSQLIEVQNWDNSLATVPPRFLLTNSFRNWQQMYRVGTRRIMRSIYIDVTSVRPLDDELCAAARTMPGVAAYLEQRVRESGSPQAAMAALTNAALYRTYLMEYLATHPQVAKEQSLRVTSEDARGWGLPLLMLAYLKETQDVPYRLLDAEIYEHALAVAPTFGLKLFQVPMGVDVPGMRAEALREAFRVNDPA